MTFITNTFHGDYSVGMWLADLIPVLATLIAFDINMLFVPSLTQMIFGGGAGAAEKLDSALSKIALLSRLA